MIWSSHVRAGLPGFDPISVLNLEPMIWSRERYLGHISVLRRNAAISLRYSPLNASFLMGDDSTGAAIPQLGFCSNTVLSCEPTCAAATSAVSSA
jgi:hypothetical protein